MYQQFKIVKVDSDYCDYLRKFDSKVPYNYGRKDLRPFIGVLFMVEKCEYFAPLSSPKPKHKKLLNILDLIKLDDGKLGVINFNNMIPITDKNYVEFDLSAKPKNNSEKFRISLLQNQLRWLTHNKDDVIKKSRTLYHLYNRNLLPKNVKDRCCNFKLLEEKCKEYNMQEV